MNLLDFFPGGSPVLWIGGVALACVAGFAGVQSMHLANARTDLANARTALAKSEQARAEERERGARAAREQVEQFRATEQEWRDAQNENALVARKARDLAAAGAAAADANAGRLRDRAAALAAACRRTAEDSSAVAAGPAASAPGDVLANMLGRLESAGRVIARYADDASISGEQCAADYATVRTAAPGPIAAP